MDSSAYFFCNIHDYDELIYKTRNAEKNNYKRQKYKIIDTIMLDDENFQKFKKILSVHGIFFGILPLS